MAVPRGTGLGRPPRIDQPIPQRAWLQRVSIADQGVSDRNDIEESLTINTLEYIREGAYFRDAATLPGNLQPGDVVLRLTFDRYDQKRSAHPAYFPAAFLTATLYIWIGGPIFNDTSHLSAVLRAEDASGVRLAEARSEVRERHSVSLWSPQYALPSGIDARTRLIGDLFGKVLAHLRRHQQAASLEH
jgi:hypothetical protein